jgi:Ca-activated chloride channel family protein
MYKRASFSLNKAFALFLISALVSVTFAQERTQKSKDDEDAIKLEATLVQVPVTVTNTRGAYVTNLSAKDFALYEDGVKQGIEFFKPVEEPFSVALLVDSSNSTADQLQEIRDSVAAFLDNMRANDRAMIIEFNDSVGTICELTNDKTRLRQSLSEIKGGEFTQVYEAVYTAVWEKFENVEGRKAVILFSDGIDTASYEIKEEDTLDAVVEMEDVIIYPIRYGTKPDVLKKLARRYKPNFNEQLDDARSCVPEADRLKLDQAYRKADAYLQQLAESSGGVTEYADRLSDLKGALQRIANELRQQYLLGYYPSNTRRTRQARRINVEIPQGGFRVRARPAYTQ